MTAIPRFPDKDPSEAVVLQFNFGAELLTSETLTGTPTVTVRATLSQVPGTLDPTPTDILNGAAAVDGTGKIALQPVIGGTSLNDYEIKVVANTTNPEKVLAFAATLPVRAL